MLNFNANNNTDHSCSSSDENEEHSMALNNRHSTPLGESATDEIPNNLQQTEDQEINRLIQYHETSVSIGDWLILINQSTIRVHQYSLGFNNLPIHRYFHADRDAQVEGRVYQPTDETITFSTTVIDADDEPLGTEDTQPHDAGVLRGINNNRPRYFMIHYENDDFNEDATSYTTTNDNIITQNLQIGENAQVLTNNDAPETVMDDSTYNVNPLDSVEQQDVIQSSDSSDDEDQILSSESSFDGDSEYDLVDDDNELRDQTLPTTENLNNHVRNNNQLDQIIPVNEQRTRTDTARSRNEVMEMRENVSAPSEGARQTIECAAYRIPTFNQKQIGPTGLDNESSEESID